MTGAMRKVVGRIEVSDRPDGSSVTEAEREPAKRCRGVFRRRILTRKMALVTGSWVVGIAIWEVAGRLSSPYIFASASATLSALWELARTGALWANTKVTMEELALAFVLGALAGIIGGTLGGMSRTFRTVTENWVTVGLAIPFAAIEPLLLVWFGLGAASKIALGWFACVMPVWINTRVGIESADAQLIEMTRSFGGRSRQVVRYVVLPWALPNIIEGLRFGVTRAFLGVIIGEILASRAGLGYVINSAGATLQMSKLLAAVVVVTLITLCIVQIMTLVQHTLVPWWDRKAT